MAKRNLDLAPPAPSPKPKRAKSVAAPVAPPVEPVLELEDFADDSPATPADAHPPRRHLRLKGAGVVLAALVLYALAFEITHMGKMYSGISANGVSVAGLGREAATQKLKAHLQEFKGQVVTITEGTTNLRIPVANLAPEYNVERAVDLAYAYGREGSFNDRFMARARSAFGRTTVISTLKTDDAKLVPYLTSLAEDTVTPVQNAKLAFNNNQAQVTPAAAGNRLDMGMLAQRINERLATTSNVAVAAPVYTIAPTLGTEPLRQAVGQINHYVAEPITLTYLDTSRQIDQPTIISWINVGSRTSRPFMMSKKLEDLYPAPPSADLGLNGAAVKAYVAGLGGALDQTPKNAGLAMQDGQLKVVQPSRTGIKLDQASTINSINSVLKTTSGRSVALKLDTAQADVNENNLESLGIKEQISEGETYFPGSPSTRLQNVRAGASKFNGVLLKPGETFSFGKLLGDVGPETGYVPELVILGDHEEKQYGGGLCQVSSTAFRAALAAGLPITQRVNHSFAISYYTWPYAAPGVDATIYYPGVDFKFVNDTGHYLLMQTTMKGYDLKFDFFGTKTKSGVVRGPNFITGDSDATKPSHTVFYRDVLDMDGKVTKTDTFHTYYKSSKDFPITGQFN